LPDAHLDFGKIFNADFLWRGLRAQRQQPAPLAAGAPWCAGAKWTGERFFFFALRFPWMPILLDLLLPFSMRGKALATCRVRYPAPSPGPHRKPIQCPIETGVPGFGRAADHFGGCSPAKTGCRQCRHDTKEPFPRWSQRIVARPALLIDSVSPNRTRGGSVRQVFVRRATSDQSLPTRAENSHPFP